MKYIGQVNQILDKISEVWMPVRLRKPIQECLGVE